MKHRIKMFIMDVDGTLTDGKIYIGEKGELFKTFNVKDGLGIKLLLDASIVPVMITGRQSKILTIRAHELGVKEVYQNVNNKIKVYTYLKEKYSLEDYEIAFVGDDLNDLNLMKIVGLKLTVANAIQELIEISDYTSHLDGGNGAVRDIINKLLLNQI